MGQIHNRFTAEQVKVLLRGYRQGVLDRPSIEETLGISKSTFFMLLREYRHNPDEFSLTYQRGISSLTAASFVGAIGVVGIVGRVLAGTGSDRIGGNNSLVLCSVFLTVSLVWLLFAKTVWAFYLFAILFGLAYGGEVPLMPMLIGQFFGMRAMASLVGVLIFVTNIGGALGPWAGGKIFDVTHSYWTAFAITAAAGIGALIMALVLKKYSRAEN